MRFGHEEVELLQIFERGQRGVCAERIATKLVVFRPRGLEAAERLYEVAAVADFVALDGTLLRHAGIRCRRGR